MPTWATFLGIGLGILLVGLAAGLIIADRRSVEVVADDAELWLHIYGDDRSPQRLSLTNVWRWYYLKQVIVEIDSTTGQQRGRRISSTLFLTFDPMVRTGTLEVSSPDMRLPAYEVKDFSSRSAVIVFFDDLPSGTLQIRVHQ
jgi:hypothetical protein